MSDVSPKDIAGYAQYLKGQGVPDSDIHGYTSYLAGHHGVEMPTSINDAAGMKALSDEQQLKMDESDQAQTNAIGDTLSFGHLPQIKAKLGQIFSGEGIANDENYVNRRDLAIAQQDKLAEKYPLKNFTGKAVGFAAPMLATGGASAAEELPALAGQVTKQGLLRAAGKGALVGGAMGAAQNPGDVQGVVDPLQLEARGKNAALGAAVGGTISGIANKIPDVAESLKGTAAEKALKGAGAMLKDFRKEYASDSIEKTGQFIVDNGLVKAGDTYESVAAKASDLRTTTGQQLGQGYEAANKILDRMDPQSKAKVAAAGFNPVRDKDALLAAVKKDLGYSYKGKAALQGLSDYLDQLAEQHGDVTLNPAVTNEIKTALDKSAINWERNPLAREPDAEAALKSLRSALNDKVSAQVGAIGEVIGDDAAAKRLAELNAKYGMAAKVARISGDRAQRESANAAFGLREGVGSIVGTSLGTALTPVLGPAGPLVGFAGGTAVAKGARNYGPALISAGANKLAGAAQSMASVAEPFAARSAANPAVYKGAIAALGAGVAEKSAAVAPLATTPTKGPDKWAADGLKNLKQHNEKAPVKFDLEKAKSKAQSDPKLKQLLIAASSLKPGSPAMADISAQIKAQLAKGGA